MTTGMSEPNEGDMSFVRRAQDRMRKSVQIELPMSSADDAVSMARRALIGVRAIDIEEGRLADGTVVMEGRTRPSVRSFGEQIRVSVTVAAQTIDIRFETRPRTRTTLIDYGKGAANVRRFRNELARLSRARPPA